MITTVVTVIIVIIVCIISFAIFQKKTNAFCKSLKRLEGKIVLVTGGTAGMGLEIATELARRGARVIVACPYPEEGKAALESIVKVTGNHDVEFQYLDLSSLAITRRFAADILAREPQLDLLINNAGVSGPFSTKTADGINFVMQVNYFGTFLLTLLLVPLLVKSGSPAEPSRIVNTTSIMHVFGSVDFAHFCYKRCIIFSIKYYSDSKFCVVLFTRELAKQLREENVVVNCVNPGAVGTKIFDAYGVLLGRPITWLFFCLFKTPWQGAQTALHVALDESTSSVSGEYFENCRQSKANSRACNDTLAQNVWKESLKVVNLDDIVCKAPACVVDLPNIIS